MSTATTRADTITCPHCDARNRVPAAAISSAMANPDRVSGYRQRCNLNVPVAPWNGMRTRLSVRNVGVPYHPMANPLVFKCGCP